MGSRAIALVVVLASCALVEPGEARAGERLGPEPEPATAPALAPEPSPRLPVESSLLTGVAQVSQSGVQYSVRPLDGTTDIVTHYAYGVPNASCANTGLEMTSTSLVYLYQDTSFVPAPLSLVMINDLPLNPAGGAATFDISGLPAPADYAVLDDPGDVYINAPPIAGQTTAQWNWGTCCTDGAAIDGLESDPFCIIIRPAFTAGIRTWQLLGGPDRAAPTRTILPSTREPLYICGDCLTMTCPAPIVAECTGPGFGHVDVQVLGGSLCGGEIITNDRTAGGRDASDDYPIGSTDVQFNLVDAAGFTTSCTTTVTVQDNLPPAILTCPSPLTLDCTGASSIPVSDPRIQAWLATFDARDPCTTATLSNDAPAEFPATCLPTLTTVTFRAVDALGHESTCTSTVEVRVQCLALPLDVGAALRVRDHGDPHAADISATLDFTLDEGLPRPADEHYHVLRGTSPAMLSQVAGSEPWATLTFDDSTPAAATLPFVHYYSILAAGPCDDVSLD